ncbi:Hypothetical protein GbCGDNIH9_1567 [Granulibacter bethesdensis]|uniref:Uncharacterized protein n=1 Tax=Granulibacter bethesdensis TaxID=364410 RepID=A0AAC9KCL9_9PROT|nr:hypothetical protein [Granulibacter bethesdensis]APH54853.1 Hypothetical protein GbCGDNIH9_1567 [Granulibacter bethesdensis]APH62439.1 Hypothetical protein GbCGDNIH8_1567 [Granulibacter bethesdensis]
MPKTRPFCPASRLISLRFRDVAQWQERRRERKGARCSALCGIALAMSVLILAPAMAQTRDVAPHPAPALASIGAVQRAELHARAHEAPGAAAAPPIRVSQQPVQHVPDSESAGMRRSAEAALEAKLGRGISISDAHAARVGEGKGGESQWYICGSVTRSGDGAVESAGHDSGRFVAASSGALLLESDRHADFGWTWAHVCSPENAPHNPPSAVSPPALPPVSAGGKRAGQ